MARPARIVTVNTTNISWYFQTAFCVMRVSVWEWHSLGLLLLGHENSILCILSPSNTLCKFPEKQPGVFLGTCEQSSAVSAPSVILFSSHSLPLSWLNLPKCCPNKHLSVDWQIRKKFVPHLITLPTFPPSVLLSLRQLLFLNCPKMPPPIHPHTPPCLFHSFCYVFVYHSHASFAVFSDWLLTPTHLICIS